MSYFRRAVWGMVAVAGGTAGQTLIHIGVILLLARLLDDAQFGALAVALTVAAIMQAITENGVGVALVQRTTITDDTIDSALAVAGGLSIAGAGLLGIFAPALADFFAIPNLHGLLALAAMMFCARTIYAVFRSLLQRQMRYRTIAMIDAAGALVYGAVALALGLHGFGAAAVLLGQTAGAFVALIAARFATGHAMRGIGRWRQILDLLRFGAWVTMSRFSSTMATHLDKFVVSRALSSAALGGYFLAQRLVILVPGLVVTVIDHVMLPIYARWKDDPARLAEGYWRGLRMTAMLMAPLAAILVVAAEPVVVVAFGPARIETAPLVRIMAIWGVCYGVGGGMFSAVAHAIGRPWLVTATSAAGLVVAPVCLGIGSCFGLIGIAWGFVAIAAILRLFAQWLLSRALGLSVRRYFREISLPLIAGLVAAVVADFTAPPIAAAVAGGWPELAAIACDGAMRAGMVAGVYLAMCTALLPADLRALRDALFRARR